MPLPNELRLELEETTVVGDMDGLEDYIEGGQAYLDWKTRMAIRIEEMDDYVRDVTLSNMEQT